MTTERVEDAYPRIHHRLWHSLLGYTGDPELASDAEAEAFSQALRRGSDIDDVDAWVWRCAFRVAGGLLRDRAQDVVGWTVDAEGSVIEASVLEFLAQLGGLSDQQRAIVVLRYAGGFKPAEIAELLHTSPGTVRVQLHRAHAHLRAAMESSDGR